MDNYLKITRIAAAIISIILAFTLCGLDISESYGEDSSGKYIPLPSEYTKNDAVSSENIMGADFSSYQQKLQSADSEMTWKDQRGNETDPFQLLVSQGINTISAKVLVDPDTDTDNRWYSLDNAIATFKKAKEAGLKINAVFTFSDWMTGDNYNKPAERWNTGEDSGTLGWNAGQYVLEELEKMKQEGVLPDIVTVGNSINWDFLGFTDGWDVFNSLSKVTSQIRDKYSDMKIAVSFKAPDSAEGIKWFVSGDNSLNGQWCTSYYDYVIISFYPTDVKNSYSGDAEYISEMLDVYKEAQGNDHSQPLLINTNIPYVCSFDDQSSSDDRGASLYGQMSGLYGLLGSVCTDSNQGGIIWEKADDLGGWSSLFAGDGSALPTTGIFETAVTGSTDAVIDPYRYGGESGMKDAPVTVEKIPSMAENSIRGADASSWYALSKAGVRFFDREGNPAPLFKILADSGINYIRIRVWNDPNDREENEGTETVRSYGGGANDVDTGIEIAKEAAKYDMKVLLCLQYSDFWTSPVQQLLPKAWLSDMDDPEKMTEHYSSFTRETIQRFKNETNAQISMVQIGNEITSGIPGVHDNTDPTKDHVSADYRHVWKDAEKSALADRYLKAAIVVVREELPDSLVALHLETIYKEKYEDIMKVWERDGLDYDVLGTSYYPFYNMWQNTPENLTEIAKLAARYEKLVCVMENSWCATLEDADGTSNTVGPRHKTSSYQVSPQGQADELSGMYSSILDQPNGLGAFYWEPAWIPVKAGWVNYEYNTAACEKYGCGWASHSADDYYTPGRIQYAGSSSWENNALFDMNGHPLGSLRFYEDSVSTGDVQTVRLRYEDASGKKIRDDSFVKVQASGTKKVTLPKITGYGRSSYILTVSASASGDIRTLTVKYKKLAKGQIQTVSGSKYRITKVASASAQGTVTLTRAKNVKSFAVPKTVRLSDKKLYKVTVTAAGAFKAAKLRTVTVGANVNKLAKNSFAKSKAVKVILKTKKLTAKNIKGCFRSSKVKTVKVSVGTKKMNRTYVKKYRKIFTKKNTGRSVTVR